MRMRSMVRSSTLVVQHPMLVARCWTLPSLNCLPAPLPCHGTLCSTAGPGRSPGPSNHTCIAAHVQSAAAHYNQALGFEHDNDGFGLLCNQATRALTRPTRKGMCLLNVCSQGAAGWNEKVV